MKKIASIIMIVMMCMSLLPSGTLSVSAADEIDTYISNLSEMIDTYGDDNYFATMSVTIGEPEMVIDGKSVSIDESGSVAYIENGRTMMPVRGVAEAIGAEVSFDDATKTVTVANEDTTIAMTIGKNEMEVNGETVILLSAPEIKADRTMLPIRDVAEALDCEVQWQEDTQTAVFTRDYQTKRVIVNSIEADTTGAVSHFSAYGKTVIQFDSIAEAKKSVDVNTDKGLVAEPDYIRKISAMSWGISDIGSQSYYSDVSYASGSAIVAVADTGIDLSHEYFKGKLVSGYDLAENDSNPQDTDGHGTHVSSTVLDVAGFNPNIKVMPLKIFEDGEEYCYSTTVASSIEYAIKHGANVINLSIGGEGFSEVEQDAINKAYRNNVAVVAAAGNEKLNLDNSKYSPAGLDNVITVSAMNKDGTLASFSNYGKTKLEFTAPGVGIKGAKLGGGYCTMGGTSMASPHVAGAYAIVKAAHPEDGIDEIVKALGESAKDKGNTHYFGHGLIRVNSVEGYLSSVSCDDEKVSNISETSAVLSGTVKYNGIVPQYVGARLGTSKDNKKDVHKVRFSDNGNHNMNFKCELKSLKPGTTYYVCLFMQPGGYDYISETIKFTTKGTPPAPKPEPEPEPEPEPIKSDLKIIPDKYPKGRLRQGSSFGLSGRIKSNCHITDVRSYILDENKKVVQEASGWTTTQTYVIEGSKLDTGLKFGKLSSGKYYVKYYAEDETGNKISWISEVFEVVSEEKAPEPDPMESDLRILPEDYPRGSVEKGLSYGISGRIKSDCHITDVRSYILDSNKNVVQEASGWTTTATYVIENSALDRGLLFGELSEGTYYLRFNASDESGNTVTWISEPFEITTGVDKSKSKSELTITPKNIPSGQLQKGAKFYLSGRIRSNFHITDVRAYILDANKNIVMEAKGSTTTQAYVIENSNLDKGMKFGELAKGSYYLRYAATDASGKTVTWTSELFHIK